MLRRILATSVAVGLAGCVPASRSSPEAEVRAVIEQRLEAFTHDGKAYREVLKRTEERDYFATDEAGGFRDSPDDGSDFTPALLHARPSASLEDLRTHRYGESLVASYRTRVRLTFNGEPCVKAFRVTEVFHRTGGRWRSVARHEGVEPGRPTWRADIDPRVLDELAGEYRLLPGVTYRFEHRNGRLFWGPGGEVELIPESVSTFATDGAMDYRVLFLRDGADKVVAARIREYAGVEYNALRVAPSAR